MTTELAPPTLTPEQRTALAQFFNEYDRLRPQIDAELQKTLAQLPALAEVVRRMTPQQLATQSERSRGLQRAALVDGDWRPYLTDLREQGARYAQAGIPFTDWFKLLTAFRTALLGHFAAEQVKPERQQALLDAMNLFIDTGMAAIGEAYLHTKERIIGQQQEAIRELSTPVLQVRDRLLIIPVVGVVDTRRARQLTESMLGAIRDRRARAVVMDITGVPIVDSKVANHLAQACEAARLMGARVILTGVSAEIAQALVTIGAELRGVETLGDLQSGIEAAEHQLGMQVVAMASPPPPASLPAGG